MRSHFSQRRSERGLFSGMSTTYAPRDMSDCGDMGFPKPVKPMPRYEDMVGQRSKGEDRPAIDYNLLFATRDF